MADDPSSDEPVEIYRTVAPEVREDLEFGLLISLTHFQLQTSRCLAYGLFVAFAASLVIGCAMAFKSFEDGLRLLQVLAPLTGGPLAVALGFYFGASRS